MLCLWVNGIVSMVFLLVVMRLSVSASVVLDLACIHLCCGSSCLAGDRLAARVLPARRHSKRTPDSRPQTSSNRRRSPRGSRTPITRLSTVMLDNVAWSPSLFMPPYFFTGYDVVPLGCLVGPGARGVGSAGCSPARAAVHRSPMPGYFQGILRGSLMAERYSWRCWLAD